MSFFIDSKDFTGSNKFNGKFSFNIGLRGTYTLVHQRYIPLSNSEVNWCNSTNNILHVTPSFSGGVLLDTNVTFGNISSNEPEDIKQWFLDAFAPLAEALWSLTTTVTYNNITNVYTLTFNKIIELDLLLPSEMGGSTIAELFAWTPNGTNVLPNDGVNFTNPYTVFNISGQNFGTPGELGVQCPEIGSRAFSSNGEEYSFFIATDNTEMDEQKIYIQDATTDLNFIVKKVGAEDVIDYNANYELFFKKS